MLQKKKGLLVTTHGYHVPFAVIKGKGRNPNPKQNRVKGTRRKTCPESNAFTVMNSGTMPRSFHTRRKRRILQEEQWVKLWICSSSLILI